MGRLNGKTCLVTAAGQGIGRSIASAFLAEGARVVATDIDASKLDALAALGAQVEQLDVLDARAVEAAAVRRPETDVLVNCAGYVAVGTILDCAPDDLRRSLALNVEAMYAMTRAFLPAMVARAAGSVINIASVASTVMAPPERFAYSVSKAGVIALTMSVARDFATAGIRCNAISPGTVDSPSLQARMAATGDAVRAREAFVARQLLGRIGEPEEIAAVAVLLASDEARFMTGSNIIIDGGMSL